MDDNAFTNHMAAWNIRKALEYCGLLRSEKPALYKALTKARPRRARTCLGGQSRGSTCPSRGGPGHPPGQDLPHAQGHRPHEVQKAGERRQHLPRLQPGADNPHPGLQAGRHPHHVPAARRTSSAPRSRPPTGTTMSPAPCTTPPCRSPPTASSRATWATAKWPTSSSRRPPPSTSAPT